MQIITFSGVDGSGKSTQVALLKAWYEQSGKRVAYIHAVEFSLANRLIHLKERLQGKAPVKKSARTKSNPFGLTMRKIFLVIDLVRFKIYRTYLAWRGVDILLSDRYFYDTLVNIAYLEGTSLKTGFVRSLFRFIPKPERAFFIDVAPETIIKRSRVPEQGLGYLKDKLSIFHEIEPLWGFIRISGEASQEESHQAIKNLL